MVGKHARWNPHLEDLAMTKVRQLLQDSDPMWITVHVRRNDFKLNCYDVPVDECLAPISAYVKRVDQVKQELADRDIIIKHVIVTSDETDETWWNDIYALGWKRLQVLDIDPLYGGW